MHARSRLIAVGLGHEGARQAVVTGGLSHETLEVERIVGGGQGVIVTDRASTGQVAFQAPRIADFDVFEKVESHQLVTTGPIEFMHGTVPGNIVGFRSVKSQLTGMSEQDSDGITHYQMDCRHLPDTGDDEFALVFK
ncbi:hypothetical protein [Chromohalobacter japonicus]|uniref:hypothetical protein n=1 Tax=Chromohalobacter japonicus TaxID=223900 RepID=UPI00211D537F|nr:hypothetical protein [Chromohalobacter japonicus]